MKLRNILYYNHLESWHTGEYKASFQPQEASAGHLEKHVGFFELPEFVLGTASRRNSEILHASVHSS